VVGPGGFAVGVEESDGCSDQVGDDGGELGVDLGLGGFAVVGGLGDGGEAFVFPGGGCGGGAGGVGLFDEGGAVPGEVVGLYDLAGWVVVGF
jgi:hypothetical protein